MSGYPSYNQGYGAPPQQYGQYYPYVSNASRISSFSARHERD